MNLNARVVSISNNILNINIKIENRWKQGWKINVGVYVYIIVVHQKHIMSFIQNDEPPDRSINELTSDNEPLKSRFSDYSNSYF